MKITLIGGSGFVGCRLMNILDGNSDYELQNIDLEHSRFFDKYTEIGDVRKQDDMDRMLDGSDCVILLAAKHRDDVKPVSEYYETNVGGMENTLKAMEKNGVKRLIFFSSVAVYGLNKNNPDEQHPKDPFNDYGKSKWQAEQVLQEWYKSHSDWNISIIRPTVIFGERNRGNVYNLLWQIQSGKFLMVGDGNNKKSMAYIGNVVAFVKFLIDNQKTGYEEYNYIDKPDYTMNELVLRVSEVMGYHIPHIHFPYWLGMLGGKCFDMIAFITRRKLRISSVRVKKFCATTEFNSQKMLNSGFVPPYSIKEGIRRTLQYEFKEKCDHDTKVSIDNK